MMPDGSMATGHAVSEVSDPEPVDTGMGKLSAYPVTTITTFPGGRCDNTTWFRTGVGLIRLRQETVSKGRRSIVTLVLTNYALKRS